MRLIGLGVILTVGLSFAPLAVEAQQPGKVSRIGVLELVIILTTAKGSASASGSRFCRALTG